MGLAEELLLQVVVVRRAHDLSCAPLREASKAGLQLIDAAACRLIVHDDPLY